MCEKSGCLWLDKQGWLSGPGTVHTRRYCSTSQILSLSLYNQFSTLEKGQKKFLLRLREVVNKKTVFLRSGHRVDPTTPLQSALRNFSLACAKKQMFLSKKIFFKPLFNRSKFSYSLLVRAEGTDLPPFLTDNLTVKRLFLFLMSYPSLIFYKEQQQKTVNRLS